MEEKYFSKLYKIGSLQKAKGGELYFWQSEINDLCIAKLVYLLTPLEYSYTAVTRP